MVGALAGSATYAHVEEYGSGDHKPNLPSWKTVQGSIAWGTNGGTTSSLSVFLWPRFDRTLEDPYTSNN